MPKTGCLTFYSKLMYAEIHVSMQYIFLLVEKLCVVIIRPGYDVDGTCFLEAGSKLGTNEVLGGGVQVPLVFSP